MTSTPRESARSDRLQDRVESLDSKVNDLQRAVGRLTELLVDRLPVNIVNPYASAHLPDREGISLRDYR